MDDNNYMCFTPMFPQDMATKLFEKKYGKKPAKVFVELGLLKVGPEPEKRNNAKANPT